MVVLMVVLFCFQISYGKKLVNVKHNKLYQILSKCSIHGAQNQSKTGKSIKKSQIDVITSLLKFFRRYYICYFFYDVSYLVQFSFWFQVKFSGTYSEPCQISKMELFEKIVYPNLGRWVG